MNIKSNFFLFNGILVLIALLLAKELIFLYQFGTDGIDLLPIHFFEFLLLGLAMIIGVILLIVFIFLVRKNKIEVGNKTIKAVSLLGLIWVILMVFLLNLNLRNLIIPLTIVIFTVLLFTLKPYFQINLVFLLFLLILSVISLLLEGYPFLITIMAFSVVPILIGVSQIFIHPKIKV